MIKNPNKFKSEDEDVDGYLQSEKSFQSTESESQSEDDGKTTSSENSQTEEDEEETKTEERSKISLKKKRTTKTLKRSYNIINAESGDNSKSSSHHSSIEVHENKSTSDIESDSDSDMSMSSSESVDTDDTGNVADRRPRKKHFAKVFVVNRKLHKRNGMAGYTSDSCTQSSSDANLEDSSDNDTDTERTDCGVVLRCIKLLNEDSDNNNVSKEIRDSLHESDSCSDSVALDCKSDVNCSLDNDQNDNDCHDNAAHEQEFKEDDEDKSECRSSREEIANCIFVVGGQTDDDNNGGVVLQKISLLNTEENLHFSNDNDHGIVSQKVASEKQQQIAVVPPFQPKAKHNFCLFNEQHEQLEHSNATRVAKHASLITAVDYKQQKNQKTDTVQQQQQTSSLYLVVDEACEELHSISNDVNRLLALTKQNSELEIKLQKLKRGVAEINQDHLNDLTGTDQTSTILTTEQNQQKQQENLQESIKHNKGISKVSLALKNTIGSETKEEEKGKKLPNTLYIAETKNKSKTGNVTLTTTQTLTKENKNNNENVLNEWPTSSSSSLLPTAATINNEYVKLKYDLEKVEIPVIKRKTLKNNYQDKLLSESTTSTTTDTFKHDIYENEFNMVFATTNENFSSVKHDSVEDFKVNYVSYMNAGENDDDTPEHVPSEEEVTGANADDDNKCSIIYENKRQLHYDDECKCEENKNQNKFTNTFNVHKINNKNNKNKISSSKPDTSSSGTYNFKLFNEQVTQTYGKEEQQKISSEAAATKQTLKVLSNKPEHQQCNEAFKINEPIHDGYSFATTTITNSSCSSSSAPCSNLTEYFMDSLETTAANLPSTGREETQSQQKPKTEHRCQQQVVDVEEEKSNEPSLALILQVSKEFACSEINVLSSFTKARRAEFASLLTVENQMLNETHGKRGDNEHSLNQSSYYDDINTSNDYSNLGAIRKLQHQKPQNFIQTTAKTNKPAALKYCNKKQQQQYFNNICEINNNKDKIESYYSQEIGPEVVNYFDNEDDDVFGFQKITKNNPQNCSQKLLSIVTNSTSEDPQQIKEVSNASVLSAKTSILTPTKYHSTHVNSSPNTLTAKYRSLIMITKDQELAQRSNESDNTTHLNSENQIEKSYSNNNENIFENNNKTDENDQMKSDNSEETSENIKQMSKLTTSSSVFESNNKNDESSLVAQIKIISPHHNNKINEKNKTVQDNEIKSASLLTVDLLRDQCITNNDDDDYESYEEYDSNTNVTIKKCTKIPPVILEDGLADDDSWVEELSEHGDAVSECRAGEEEGEEEDDTTPTCTDSEDGDDPHTLGMFQDREEELRGYHRTAIDFTLHTIVEESCEESEVASLRSQTDEEELDDLERRRQKTLQHHHRLSASELEKYFFFGLGDGKVMSSIDTHGEDTASEVSSVCSEGLDSLGIPDEPLNDVNQAADLASSRLEKYFILMGFNSTDKNGSDESGSVGSDSEGHPSPSQRRKRLVRARTTPRSHNSSLDNLLLDSQNTDSLENSLMPSTSQDIIDSSESENCDETVIHNNSASERTSDGADTIKRKKQLRKRHDSLDEKKLHDTALDDCSKNSLECRTPTPGSMSSSHVKKQQHHSRDSGFVGSNDDLLKSPESDGTSHHARTKSPTTLEQIKEDNEKLQPPIPALRLSTITITSPSTTDSENSKQLMSSNTNLVRKDSFNNWSSDEETNLMMCKMRQFFKTLVVATANAQQGSASNSKSTTPNQTTPISVRRMKSRPNTFAYFENELTRLMKTVPGINDEQVREIVEYLSSEDTWSDSYDSSDYNSSDLEGSSQKRNELKQQISDSCQQIINKFEVDEEGDRGDGGLLDDPRVSNSDTSLVYQKLVASFSKMAVDNANANLQLQNESDTRTTEKNNASSNLKNTVAEKATVEEDRISTGSTRSAEKSPQLFARVMQHIGTRLVALMHEVSSGNDTHGTNSPMPAQRCQHKRLQAKISATTTEDEEDTPTENILSSYSRSSHYLHPSQAQHIYQGTRSNKYAQDEAYNLARSKSHDLLLDSTTSMTASSSNNTGSGCSNNHHTTVHNRPHHHQSSSGVSDTAGEECGVASDYERFSWRGSFESALLANGDSRTKLSQLDRDNSSSASALAIAKRRSAGDLLFNHKSLSREQLDRVRSCGSIGGGDEHHHVLESSPAKPWLSSNDSKDVRRSSVPDAIYETDTSSSDDDCEAFTSSRSTLPRSLIGVTQMSTTNSLPRLPTTGNQTNSNSVSLGLAAVATASSTSALTSGMSATSTPISSKSQNSLNFTPTNSAKSARYRPPGLKSHHNFASINVKKCSQSNAQVLQHFLYPKRDARKRLNLSSEEAKAAAEELNKSPVMGLRNTNDPTSSPIQSRGSASSDNWPTQSDEDIDRWVALHQNRGSFSSLGPRSDSMASVYSGAGEGRYGTVVVKGQVEFGMQYNYKLGALEIHVVRCKDLAAVDAKRNRSDPYVKVYLLPDKTKAGKRKTKVKKHTLNPIFDEVLRFHMPISSIESRTLWLTVWHSDMFGRNDFLGEVNINLQGRVFDNPQSQWYLLQERSEPFDEVATYRGDIVVGLKYVTPEGSKSKFMRAASLATGGGLRKFGSIKSVATSKTDRLAKGGQLHVLVKEAKHLTPIKPSGSCDAFCKSYLLPDRTRSSKQKTPIVKRSTNPSWNYTFIYEDVSLEDLSERALELTVWDHDRLASNEFLGGVRFSLGTCKSYGRQVDWMDASGKELSLWQNMLDRPNFWVEGSVVLRSTLEGIRAIP